MCGENVTARERQNQSREAEDGKRKGEVAEKEMLNCGLFLYDYYIN